MGLTLLSPSATSNTGFFWGLAHIEFILCISAHWPRFTRPADYINFNLVYAFRFAISNFIL